MPEAVKKMRRVVSASRRTDLPAAYPRWLADALVREEVSLRGPRGGPRIVDLRPESVHTIVLWSKDFSRLLSGEAGLRVALAKYRQAFFLFTVTGLGGTAIEPDAPAPERALDQLAGLVELAGRPERVSLRFDPIVHWREVGAVRSNLSEFEGIAAAAARAGIGDIRISFAQWYGKAARRALTRGFAFVDPAEEEKLSAARRLAEIAVARGLALLSCAQDFLARVPGIRPSSCIDGRRLSELHPDGEPAPGAKDRSQRAACRCTESVDIGSYAQDCRQGCVYCYANR